MGENDEHRRVEPRGAIAGSGMLTDPERIRQIEHDAARHARAWRKHEKKFGEVLEKTPPLDATDDDSPPDAETRASAPGDETEAADAAAASKDLPRVPPDPRMRALHAQLDRAGGRGKDDT